MLSPTDLQLLTAFVDGELTSRERNAVLRLLNQSSAARAFVQDLQENAHRLRELPRHKLGEAFAGEVLEAIGAHGLRPAPDALPVRRVRPKWVRYATAASVVLAVALGVFVVSRGGRRADEPLRVAFHELTQVSKRKVLSEKIQAGRALHLDVTVRDHASAVERLKGAFEGHGITMIVDSRTETGAKKEEKAGYLVYAENLRADELDNILLDLADESKNHSAFKKNFETMIVSSMSAADRESLSGLLGVSETELEAPKEKGGADRFAMVFPRRIGTNEASAEVKMFLAGRKQQKRGTVQVLLVIHQV